MIAAPVRQIDQFGLVHLYDSPILVIESSIMLRDSGIMNCNLAQFFSGSDSPGDNGIGIDHSIIAGLNRRKLKTIEEREV